MLGFVGVLVQLVLTQRHVQAVVAFQFPGNERGEVVVPFGSGLEMQPLRDPVIIDHHVRRILRPRLAEAIGEFPSEPAGVRSCHGDLAPVAMQVPTVVLKPSVTELDHRPDSVHIEVRRQAPYGSVGCWMGEVLEEVSQVRQSLLPSGKGRRFR